MFSAWWGRRCNNIFTVQSEVVRKRQQNQMLSIAKAYLQSLFRCHRTSDRSVWSTARVKLHPQWVFKYTSKNHWWTVTFNHVCVKKKKNQSSIDPMLCDDNDKANIFNVHFHNYSIYLWQQERKHNPCIHDKNKYGKTQYFWVKTFGTSGKKSYLYHNPQKQSFSDLYRTVCFFYQANTDQCPTFYMKLKSAEKTTEIMCWILFAS